MIGFVRTSPFFSRSHRAHSIGAMQSAINIEPIMEKVTAYASGLNNLPSMPCNVKTGRKTAMMMRMAKNMGRPISCAATRMAERVECSRAGVQEQHRAHAAADQRRNREQKQPSWKRGEIAPESDHACERTRPQRGRVGGIGENRIAAQPDQRGEGDQGPPACDRINDAGSEGRQENDER